MRNSKIEWTEDTWNPVTGCSRVSAGCDNCYAARISHRFAHLPAYEGLTVLNGKGDRHFNGTVRLLPERLTDPIKRKRPTTWFVNSMSDLFHERVPFEFIDKVMGVMALCQRHTFQVLTKRTQRMAEYLNTPQRSQLVDASMLDVAYDKNLDPMNLPRVVLPLPNVWFGTSIENQATADERIPLLRECPAAVRFLSCEPLLGPLDLTAYMDASYSTHHANDKTHGRDCLSVGTSAWSVSHRPQGKGVERNKESGEFSRTLSYGQNNERGETIPRTGQPSSMEALFRINTGAVDGKPQERKEERQQARKPGTGDVLRTGDSLSPRSEEEPARIEPTRQEQSHVEVERCGGHRHTQEKVGGGKPEQYCQDLRRSIPNHLKDCFTPFLGARDLVIVGGESGPGARYMEPDWARSIRDQCKAAGVPFFMKQMTSKARIPDDLMIREYPR